MKNGHFNRVLKSYRFSCVICNYSITLTFYYFTGCISYLSLVIIFNKMSVSIYLEAASWRSSTKWLFYVSNKPIKLCLWKCSIFTKVAGYRSATLLKLNFFTDVFQRFGISLILSRTAILKNVDFQEQFSWRCCEKKVSLKFSQNSQEARMGQSLFLNKSCSSQLLTLLEKGIWHTCFPVSLVKF